MVHEVKQEKMMKRFKERRRILADEVRTCHLLGSHLPTSQNVKPGIVASRPAVGARKIPHIQRMAIYLSRTRRQVCACNMTGFLPIHCAVANGRIRMYDLLTGARNHLACAAAACCIAVSPPPPPEKHT